jgi:hypothetical protein
MNQIHEMQIFFIRDKLDDGDLAVVYCLTEIMWADVLTKPQQGGPFCLDRSILMNIPINYNKDVEHNITHPLLIPKDKRNNLINNQVPTPLIHHRSMLGANRPNSTHFSPTNPYSLTYHVRPMPPMSQKLVTGKISNTMPAPPDLTWADQAKAPADTE